MIRARARAPTRLIAVSAALRERLVGAGRRSARAVTVLRNGVDLTHVPPARRPRRAPAPRSASTGPTLLSVGHLIERKGHDRIIAALARCCRTCDC